ncbi:ATP-binding cassette domain-containing protein, partial [Alphaproteobacteria bacterium]|nr:ATP-binding cassette domain-containing protein [Alphaproteobacteria bacterium]
LLGVISSLFDVSCMIMKNPHHITIECPSDQSKCRIDKFITDHLSESNYSRSRIKALIQDGNLLIDDTVIDDPSASVKPGSCYILTIPAVIDDTPQAEDIQLDILFEDADLIVINKPAGLVVHPAPGSPNGTLVNALLYHCGEGLTGIGGVARPGIVHRLDKETSGVMVAAKSQHAHIGLSELFASHTINRKYEALCWGVPSAMQATIDAPLGRHMIDRKKQTIREKQKRLEVEGRKDDARVRSLSRELDWVRSAPKARQAKSKARLNAYEKMLEEQQSNREDIAKIVIPAGPRLGDVVIEADNLSKAFGDKLLVDNLDFRLPPGGIVGVIGPNGAGKTTLFRMLVGQETPDQGSLKLGDTVQLGYVDQSRDALDDSKTVWEVISGGLDEIELGKRTMPSRAYVSLFNFKGADQQKKVSQLSGGERNRVHLSKMLKSGANVLLLDEPTNDLDVDTLRALEEALLEFAGCAVVVSHDRWFLDRIATHILAFEGNSHVEWFEGNYEAYEADKKRRLGSDAAQPSRIKYKPISRG